MPVGDYFAFTDLINIRGDKIYFLPLSFQFAKCACEASAKMQMPYGTSIEQTSAATAKIEYVDPYRTDYA